MSAERWKMIPGLGDAYAVSNRGRIKQVVDTYKHKAGTILSFDVRRKPRSKTSYCRIRLGRPGYGADDCKGYSIHRLVAVAFIGDANGREINHKNGIGTDNRVENLEWCTRQENCLHNVRYLKRNRGETHSQARLSTAAVRSIIMRWHRGEHKPSIAKRFGVSRYYLNEIVSGKKWKHIDREALLHA